MEPEALDDQFRYLDVGIACERLLSDPASWINRRVETVEMLTYEETRWRISVDFTLTQEQQSELSTDDGVIIPLLLLTKEPRRHFDLRDESARALPVLGRHANGDIARFAMMAAAFNAGTNLDQEQTAELLADLEYIVTEPAEQAEDELALFVGRAEAGDPIRTPLWRDGPFRTLLKALASNYVVCAVLPAVGVGRRVIKCSFAADIPQSRDEGSWVASLWRRLRAPDSAEFFIDFPSAWRARSFHVEIAIPEELRIQVAGLYDFSDPSPVSDLDEDANRASLYLSSPVDSDSETIGHVRIIPERSGRIEQAAWLGFAVSLLLWVGVISGLKASNPAPAVTILLAGSAIYSGLISFGGEHRVVTAIYSAPRRWLRRLAFASLLATGSLALEFPSPRPSGVWTVSAILATLATARLALSAARAAK